MSIKTQHNEGGSFYFCTFTCNRWINLIDETKIYDKVYAWFDRLFSGNNIIAGYVIMPNHCHFIVFYPEQEQTLNKLIGNGKRFLAYEIVERLKQQRAEKLLNILEMDVKPSDKKKGKLHEVFRYSFDAKLIYNNKMMTEKLIYIHNNPISKKWNLAEDAVSYLHSSAAFYAIGITKHRWLKHYKDI